jgi:polyferredoxin
VLFVMAANPLPSWVPVDLFLRLDPLLGAGASLAAREATANFLWTLPLLALAVLAGRAFCGWLCPMGVTLDLAAPVDARQALARPGLERLRRAKYLALFLALGSLAVGGAALLLLDPISLLTRSLATALYPLLNLAVTALQVTLYGAGVAPDLWVAVDTQWRGSLLPYFQPYFQMAALFLGLFALVLAANRVAPRSWCRYLCPLGATFAIFARWAPLRRRLDQSCNHCGRCTSACSMDAIDAKTHAADPAECILCLGCREECPRDAISYGLAPAVARYDPTRRQVLLGLTGGALALGSLRVSASAAGQHPLQVRPPGAVEGFLSRCVRCGECMKVCPTSGLQPSVLESGLEGMWSPVLVSRLGFCDFSCTSCGQVCPTGAIAPLHLEDKRKLVIGVAYLDERRCLPYADATPCIVCEEMCPLPDKAIVLEPKTATKHDGTQVDLKLPKVLRDRCIGCGICEYYCPLPNESAIRVFATGPLADKRNR